MLETYIYDLQMYDSVSGLMRIFKDDRVVQWMKVFFIFCIQALSSCYNLYD